MKAWLLRSTIILKIVNWIRLACPPYRLQTIYKYTVISTQCSFTILWSVALVHLMCSVWSKLWLIKIYTSSQTAEMVYLHRYVMSGYPVSWARGSWSMRSVTQILAESWFLWREENWRTRRNSLGVRLRSTNLSPRTSPGSNPGHSGGRCGWYHCANLTPWLLPGTYVKIDISKQIELKKSMIPS